MTCCWAATDRTTALTKPTSSEGSAAFASRFAAAQLLCGNLSSRRIPVCSSECCASASLVGSVAQQSCAPLFVQSTSQMLRATKREIDASTRKGVRGGGVVYALTMLHQMSCHADGAHLQQVSSEVTLLFSLRRRACSFGHGVINGLQSCSCRGFFRRRSADDSDQQECSAGNKTAASQRQIRWCKQ